MLPTSKKGQKTDLEKQQNKTRQGPCLRMVSKLLWWQVEVPVYSHMTVTSQEEASESGVSGKVQGGLFSTFMQMIFKVRDLNEFCKLKI